MDVNKFRNLHNIQGFELPEILEIIKLKANTENMSPDPMQYVIKS
jgi:hypothetical protein